MSNNSVKARLGTPFTQLLSVAAAASTISDICQPIAPFSAYIAGVSAIAIVILAGVKAVTRIWSETVEKAAILFGSLFVLSTILYVVQHSGAMSSRIGILAAKSPVVRDFQRDVGITNELKEINKNINQLNMTAETLKKETSSDPRKELANQGISFTPENFDQTLKNGDEATVLLFIKGGQSLLYIGMYDELIRSDDKVLKAFLKYHPRVSKNLCSISTAKPPLQDLSSASDLQRRAMKAACGQYPSVKEDLKSQLKTYEHTYQEDLKNYKSYRKSDETPASCIKKLRRNNSEDLIEQASRPSVATDESGFRYELLASIRNKLIVGYDPHAGLDEEIRRYCESTTNEKPPVRPDDSFVKGLKLYLEYLQ